MAESFVCQLLLRSDRDMQGGEHVSEQGAGHHSVVVAALQPLGGVGVEGTEESKEPRELFVTGNDLFSL